MVVQLHWFSRSALDRNEWLTLRSERFVREPEPQARTEVKIVRVPQVVWTFRRTEISGW